MLFTYLWSDVYTYLTTFSSFKDGEKLLSKKERDILSGLTLQAIVGIEDPVREQVRLKRKPAMIFHTYFL